MVSPKDYQGIIDQSKNHAHRNTDLVAIVNSIGTTINTINPVANVANGVKGILTGTDFNGEESTIPYLQIFSAIPLMKAANTLAEPIANYLLISTVWYGKEKGPHFTFDASVETVNNIIKRFSK